MGLGLIHSPGAICAFAFQSILASGGFLQVLWFFLLQLKLNFLNKSVSKRFMEMSLKFNAFALLGFAWFSAKCYKMNYFPLQLSGKKMKREAKRKSSRLSQQNDQPGGTEEDEASTSGASSGSATGGSELKAARGQVYSAIESGRLCFSFVPISLNKRRYKKSFLTSDNYLFSNAVLKCQVRKKAVNWHDSTSA